MVGIAPEGFEDPIAGDVDAWVPYALARDTDAENNSLSAVGRLRSGISLEQARAELARPEPVDERALATGAPSAVVAVPLQQDLVATARGPLHLLLMAVGLVLLVACVNVANLVLARATGRVQEFGIRSALGSGSRRLVRQMLVESLVLAGSAALMGLGLAAVMVSVLQGAGPRRHPAAG